MSAGFSVASILGHSFIPEFIRPSGVVIDCGANKGEFSKWFSENTTATIHSFEADTRLSADLPALERVSFYNTAINGESGEMDLYLFEKLCSSSRYSEGSVGSMRVKSISLDDFCASMNITSIDLLKLDIEGSELSLLQNTSDATLSSISQIAVEFHDFIKKSDVQEIENIAERLASLGFYLAKFSRGMWSDCLFINTRRIPMGLLDKLTIFITGRIIPGINRRLFNNRLKLRNRIPEELD